MSNGQFQKGQARPPAAGRKKGSVNRKTGALIEKCERHGIDPFEALLELTKTNNQSIQLSALKEICAYLYPKRKSVEISIDENDQDILEWIKEFSNLSVEEQIKLMELELSRLKSSLIGRIR